MPNNKSAERRMRNSARKHLQNRSTATRLHSLEKKFMQSAASGKKDDAASAFRIVASALDKAAKTGVVPRERASRKKSRLALHLNKIK